MVDGTIPQGLIGAKHQSNSLPLGKLNLAHSFENSLLETSRPSDAEI
jgi:hypothetical protein